MPAHVILVIEENRSASQIVGNAALPNFQSLIAGGALFTNSHGVTHPSLPNYFALFDGIPNTDGDHCNDRPTDSAGDLPMPSGLRPDMPTLASELSGAHRSFVGFAESLPSAGYVGCYGRGGSLFSSYYKRHVPWAFFTRAGHPSLTSVAALPDAVNEPWSAFPQPGEYDTLPTVAMVVPNLTHDMHGTALETGGAALERAADEWLGANILPLVKWAENPANNALVIITWDEGERTRSGDTNSIPTIFAGAMVRPGTYDERITHYDVLATIESMYGLKRLGNSQDASPISDCWRGIK